ncbi:hypothetical protein [Jannaschia rubra]|uniref:hypothetical protein n=1 Tax=Jannaschia rubra TaxID=282197 RepID=UPI002490B29F|nr:hypothetical protein [Jannaschia rubra]
MKRIILHCGMPKAGSSAVQVRLAQSRAALLNAGFDYLRMGDFALGEQGKISSGNGVGFARAYLPSHHPASLHAKKSEQIEKVRRAISDAERNVILSSEFFSVIPPILMRELVDDLSDVGEVELVFFTREQVSFLASDYIQKVKRHGCSDFPQAYFANWHDYQGALKYHSYLQNLENACPNTRIMVKPYEHSKSHPAGLLGLLLDVAEISVPLADLAPDRPVNLSLSPQEICILVEMNKHHPRMQFSDIMVEASQRSGRSSIHSTHNILHPDFRREIRAFFKDDNQKLFAEFIRDENLYDSLRDDDVYVDLAALAFSARDVVDVFSGMLVDIDKRVSRLEQ